jgi:hypothetical protein
MKFLVTDAGIHKTINTMQYGGSGVAGLGGVLSFLNEHAAAIGAIVGLGGLVVAIAGFVLGWIYKHKHYKLEERRTIAEIKILFEKEGVAHD